MKLLRARDLPHMPWKNGGGITMEIAVHPVEAKMDNFDWRVSMAIVSAGGPFSTFPDIDRTLTILKGGPMGLKINEAQEILLNSMSDPLFFAGDLPTTATLKGEAVTDLNVMTRRKKFGHRVTPIKIDSGSRRIETPTPSFLVVRNGALRVSQAGKIENLTEFDSVYFDEPECKSCEIATSKEASLLFIEIFSVD